MGNGKEREISDKEKKFIKNFYSLPIVLPGLAIVLAHIFNAVFGSGNILNFLELYIVPIFDLFPNPQVANDVVVDAILAWVASPVVGGLPYLLMMSFLVYGLKKDYNWFIEKCYLVPVIFIVILLAPFHIIQLIDLIFNEIDYKDYFTGLKKVMVFVKFSLIFGYIYVIIFKIFHYLTFAKSKVDS